MGGLDQPIDWRVDRQIAVKKRDNGSVVIILTGDNLAPQDHDSLTLFEQFYSTASSVLTYDGVSLKLSLLKTNLPTSVTDMDLLDLIVDTYKAVAARQTDYTETMRERYFEKTYVMERRVGETEIEAPFHDMEFERAPDVFVRRVHSS